MTTTLPWWYPYRRHHQPIYHGNPEALGFALDSVGRSIGFIGAAGFLGTALLQLAQREVGCLEEAEECEGRLFGILRPSSLLTTYTIVVGIVSATMLPFLGAVVDYTSHRRKVARGTSITICVLMMPQIYLNQQTWMMVAALQMVVAFTGWAQTMVSHAYLPELTDREDRLNEYTKSFTIINFTSMVLYLATVIGVASWWNLGDVGTAQLAMAVALIVMIPLLSVAWGPLLQPRPPARVLPPGQSLWSAGFVQIYHTGRYIHKNLPTLRWFYTAVAFLDAGINGLVTVTITYMTDQLEFSSTETGLVVLLVLVGSIPGALLASRVALRWDPVRSAMAASILLILNTLTEAIVLKGPGQQMAAYFFSIVWGIGTGWKWTNDRMLASILIPHGQDAELMGTYLFASQCLTWVPPLVFTLMNELGVSQRVGIGTFSIYFGIGVVALWMIGDYRHAVDVAKASSGTVPADVATTAKTTDAVETENR
ncbi:hypothetical protein FisN_9Hh258 [Fistulifera solaris]|uniref:MFS transporter n=1 Tax=Fistulifera solaris TaxID=1519565 RepID=A0A1Z5JAZ1_FISSO|nr:hypothetical protein FisN_9Hh258 [Fistulifera solaris]|eukprot:GAX11164.1 hypothetical protein FisN_9Hh258 [Fistulifera solaris]